MFIHCFDPIKKKNVLAGEYNSFDYTFIKKVKKNHFMIIEGGYGIQEEILIQLKNLGCINVLIITKTAQYISLLEDWLKQPTKNYGHGKQKFLGQRKEF